MRLLVGACVCTACAGDTGLDWRLLGTGEFGYTGDVPDGEGPCAPFETVLLTDQAMVDAWEATWSVTVDTVDWSSEVAVGSAAACRNWGRAITIATATDEGGGTLSVHYDVVTNDDVLDHSAILFHAAAFEDGGWESVQGIVTFVQEYAAY